LRRARAMRARAWEPRRRAIAPAVVALVASALARSNAREFPSSATSMDVASTCRSAHADARRVADDRGRTCAWYEVDVLTGCCPTRARAHACAGCDGAVDCCDEYETCVSCCLSPKRAETTRAEMAVHARGRNQVITGFFDDPFDFCANRCRTQPSVTVHENEYAYATAYCFGDFPKNEDPVPVKGNGKKAFAGDGPDESR